MYSIKELAPAQSSLSLGTEGANLNRHGDAVGTSFYMGQPDPKIDERSLIATSWVGALANSLDSPGVEAVGRAINAAKDVVGAYGTAPTATEPGIFPKHGFIYQAGVMRDLKPITATEFGYANDLNDAGVVVGGAGTIGAAQAFRWDGSVIKWLGALPGHTSSIASSINQSGWVVGTSRSDGPSADQRGFLHRGTSLEDLGPALWIDDVNDNGLVAGSVYFGGQTVTGALWDTNAAQPNWANLGALPGHDSSIAFAVNNKGQVVGHSFVAYNYSTMRAFIVDGGQMLDLNNLIPPNSGWLLESAVAIDDSGRIVANGKYLGEKRACLLTPGGLDAGSWSRFQKWIRILFGVIQDGGGLGLTPGGHPVPIDPWGPLALSESERDVFVAFALRDLSSLVSDPSLADEVRRVAQAVAGKGVENLHQQ